MSILLFMFVIIISQADEIRARKVVKIKPNVSKPPIMKRNCTNDPFISSIPFKGKVFLHPWKMDERRGDWYYNRAYCAVNCAEMVTIHSLNENTFFLNYMRSVGMVRPGAWLGAQIDDRKDIKLWDNKEKFDYKFKAPGEYDQRGLTCLNVGWDYNKDSWRNFYCTGDIGDLSNKLFIACQRAAGPTKKKSSKVNKSKNSQPTRATSTRHYSSTSTSPTRSISSRTTSVSSLLSPPKYLLTSKQNKKSTNPMFLGTTSSSQSDSSTSKLSNHFSTSTESTRNGVDSTFSSLATDTPPFALFNDSLTSTKLNEIQTVNEKSSTSGPSDTTTFLSVPPDSTTSKSTSLTSKTDSSSNSLSAMSLMSTTQSSLLSTKLSKSVEVTTSYDISRNSFSDITSSPSANFLTSKSSITSMPLTSTTESLLGLVTELLTLTEPTEAATENDILRNSFSDITSSASPALLNEHLEVPTYKDISRRSQSSDITRNMHMKSLKKGRKHDKSAKPMKDRRRFDICNQK